MCWQFVVENRPQNCEIWLLGSISCLWRCLSEITFSHGKTLPHAAIVNKTNKHKRVKTAVAT